MASSNPDALIEFLRGAAEYRGPPLPSLKPSTMAPIVSRASVDVLWKHKQETHPVCLITGDVRMDVFRHQAAYAKHTNARVMIVVGVESAEVRWCIGGISTVSCTWRPIWAASSEISL